MEKKAWVVFGCICVILVTLILVSFLAFIPQVKSTGLQAGEYEEIAKQEYTFSGTEIDKLKKSSGGKNGKDGGGEAVQQALLRLVEGGTHKVKKDKQTGATMDFNTDNVLFIAGGAFVGLEKIIADRLNKASGKANVGFGAALEKEQEQRYRRNYDRLCRSYVWHGADERRNGPSCRKPRICRVYGYV